VNDHQDFLTNYITLDASWGSEWKSYMDMLSAMEYAKKEIERVPFEGAANRPYLPSLGTSWLKYCSFEYAPSLPPELEDFLRDAVNRNEVARAYLAGLDVWKMSVKVPLPLAGTLAFLLDGDQVSWLEIQRDALLERLAVAIGASAFGELLRWRSELSLTPVPMVVVDRMEYFLTEPRESRSSP
jgi:hypothetical protein